MGRRWLAAAVVASLVGGACASGTGDRAGEGRAGTAVQSPPTIGAPTLTTGPGPEAGEVTLVVSGLRLVNSEESDNGFRVFVASPSAQVAVVLDGMASPNRVVHVCPAVELERYVGAPGCTPPENGQTVNVRHQPDYRGLQVVQVGVQGPGEGGRSTVVGTIRATFTAASREVRFRLPPVAPGEVVSFALGPPGDGTYRATGTWPATGQGELVLTSGSREISRAEGGTGTSLTGNLSPPAPATVTFRNAGTAHLAGVVLTIGFP